MTDPKRITPRWDKHRREFTVEGEIVKEFRLPSVAQIAILEAFEAADWHASITNPLDGGAKKLHNALCKLNHLQGPAFVRFERNGIGRIIWTIVKKTVPGQEKSEESDGT